MSLGLGAATSLNELPEIWADSMTYYQIQVDAVHFDNNANRKEARAIAEAMGYGSLKRII